jgi:hypothetical protein
MSPKRILATLGLIAAVTFGLVTAHVPKLRAADQRDFWFLNNTGHQVDRVYVSAHESEYWGDDVLGASALADGMGTVIVFSQNYRTSCTFDFRLVYHDGTVQTYRDGRNICSLHAVQFNAYSSQGF